MELRKKAGNEKEDEEGNRRKAKELKGKIR